MTVGTKDRRACPYLETLSAVLITDRSWKSIVKIQTLLRTQWHELITSRCKADPKGVDLTFTDLVAQYSAPDRFYHNLEHIQHVLQTAELLQEKTRNAFAVKLAAWLHDVIYDSKASDNEERSADYARQLCAALVLPDADAVASLILKTKTHLAENDTDAQVLIDADLAILGAGLADYRVYATRIRREYAWVPDADYRAGRRQVLEKFLARPRIFHHLGHLEQPARRNLGAEIAELANR